MAEHTIMDAEGVSNMSGEKDIIKELRKAEERGCFQSLDTDIMENQLEQDLSVENGERSQTTRNFVQNQIQENKRLINTDEIFEHVSIPICVISDDQIILKCNPAFEKFSKSLKNQIEKKTYWYEFISDLNWDYLETKYKTKINKKINELDAIDCTFITRDNTEKNIQLNINNIPHTQFKIVTFIDISKQKKIEQTLQESENKFKIITENSADAIFITDTQGNYQYVNTAACNLLGYSYDELIKMNIADISKKEKVEQQIRVFQELLKEGHMLSEIELRRKDGSFILADLNAVVLPNGLIYGSCRDISERKKQESIISKSEEKFRTFFDSSTDAYCIHSIPDLRIIEVNDEACKRFGYSKEEFKNISIDDISVLPSFSIKNEEKHKKIKKVFDGETQSFEWLSKTRNGKHIWHLMTLKTIEIDGKKRILAQAKDITEIKKTQEELKKRLEELQKWKKFTVGRELRMKELKEQIRKIKKSKKGTEIIKED